MNELVVDFRALRRGGVTGEAHCPHAVLVAENGDLVLHKRQQRADDHCEACEAKRRRYQRAAMTHDAVSVPSLWIQAESGARAAATAPTFFQDSRKREAERLASACEDESNDSDRMSSRNNR